ncbi:MAG: F0F1 ATP synthase subunit delta [Gammaproteobacteria bacterium]
MELNWSTFVLEIINFLVLVWILKRFLYQPVLDVIAARRKSIEEQIAQAHTIEEQAQALKAQYTGRLSEWETERRRAREQLAHEIDQERARRLSGIQSAFEQEREKGRVAEARRQAEQRRALELQALSQGAAFSSRLLAQACGPELEGRLLNLLIDGLRDMTEMQQDRLRSQCADTSQVVDVTSAFTLSAEQRERLIAALREVCAESVPVRFSQDEKLLAGLRIVVGDWVLAANVRDELKGFTELAHAAR